MPAGAGASASGHAVPHGGGDRARWGACGARRSSLVLRPRACGTPSSWRSPSKRLRAAGAVRTGGTAVLRAGGGAPVDPPDARGDVPAPVAAHPTVLAAAFASPRPRRPRARAPLALEARPARGPARAEEPGARLRGGDLYLARRVRVALARARNRLRPRRRAPQCSCSRITEALQRTRGVRPLTLACCRRRGTHLMRSARMRVVVELDVVSEAERDGPPAAAQPPPHPDGGGG